MNAVGVRSLAQGNSLGFCWGASEDDALSVITTNSSTTVTRSNVSKTCGPTRYLYSSIDDYAKDLSEIRRSFYEQRPDLLVADVRSLVDGVQDLRDDALLTQVSAAFQRNPISATRGGGQGAPKAQGQEQQPSPGKSSKSTDSKIGQRLESVPKDPKDGADDTSSLAVESPARGASQKPRNNPGGVHDSSSASGNTSISTSAAARAAADAVYRSGEMESRSSSVDNLEPLPVHPGDHPAELPAVDEESSSASDQKPPAKKQRGN